MNLEFKVKKIFFDPNYKCIGLLVPLAEPKYSIYRRVPRRWYHFGFSGWEWFVTFSHYPSYLNVVETNFKA